MGAAAIPAHLKQTAALQHAAIAAHVAAAEAVAAVVDVHTSLLVIAD